MWTTQPRVQNWKEKVWYHNKWHNLCYNSPMWRVVVGRSIWRQYSTNYNSTNEELWHKLCLLLWHSQLENISQNSTINSNYTSVCVKYKKCLNLHIFHKKPTHISEGINLWIYTYKFVNIHIYYHNCANIHYYCSCVNNFLIFFSLTYSSNLSFSLFPKIFSFTVSISITLSLFL